MPVLLVGRLVLLALVGMAEHALAVPLGAPPASHTAAETVAPEWAAAVVTAGQLATATRHHPRRACQNPTLLFCPTTTALHGTHATPEQETTAESTQAAAGRVHGPHHGQRRDHYFRVHRHCQLG